MKLQLAQWRRDDYTRRAMYENEAKQKEKIEKDRKGAEYPHKGPMGPTDPYSFRWFVAHFELSETGYCETASQSISRGSTPNFARPETNWRIYCWAGTSVRGSTNFVSVG